MALALTAAELTEIEIAVMARVFHDALTTTFRAVFDTITFAITDWSEERMFIGPFARLLATRVAP